MVLLGRVGTGASPKQGSLVEVHWSGYTKGYQVRTCSQWPRACWVQWALRDWLLHDALLMLSPAPITPAIAGETHR